MGRMHRRNQSGNTCVVGRRSIALGTENDPLFRPGAIVFWIYLNGERPSSHAANTATLGRGSSRGLSKRISIPVSTHNLRCSSIETILCFTNSFALAWEVGGGEYVEQRARKSVGVNAKSTARKNGK